MAASEAPSERLLRAYRKGDPGGQNGLGARRSACALCVCVRGCQRPDDAKPIKKIQMPSAQGGRGRGAERAAGRARGGGAAPCSSCCARSRSPRSCGCPSPPAPPRGPASWASGRTAAQSRRRRCTRVCVGGGGGVNDALTRAGAPRVRAGGSYAEVQRPPLPLTAIIHTQHEHICSCFYTPLTRRW